MFELVAGEARARFAAEEKGRAPYPNELRNLDRVRHALAPVGVPCLVVPFVGEALGRALTEAGWSWADTQCNFDLRAPGMVLRQRRTTAPPKPSRTALPQGPGSLAIIRTLIRFGRSETEEHTGSSLAAQARVSQPRASQVLHRLQALDLVRRSDSGRWIPDRAALLDRFLAEYRGPQAWEKYLYTLDMPSDVALRAARSAPTTGPIAVSADVGPDLITPWRRPSILILYAAQDIPLSELGVVEAQGTHDANVILRIPRDTSVFAVPEFVADFQGVEVPLADLSQQIWDLHFLGGADRLEAAGLLREWLLSRP
ncbi:MAG TPA: hypothetical protein VFA11_03385 [Acidimicrobiales bacterium]|nr:hypothetical protein [Acidimicrobiales bacterium]